MRYLLTTLFIFTTLFPVYSQQKVAEKYLLNNDKLKHSFIGICLYSPEEGKVIYKHNAFRLFTPASNGKLYSFYAGLRFLQDSTTGIQYQRTNDTLYIRGTGDPTFLHHAFTHQPAFDFLKSSKLPIAIVPTKNKNKVFGPGWAWEDYNYDFQAERNSFPIYGNVVRFSMHGNNIMAEPSYFSDPQRLIYNPHIKAYGYKVKRDRHQNIFYYNNPGPQSNREQSVPFITSRALLKTLLEQALHKDVSLSSRTLPVKGWKRIANVSLDKMLKRMMYKSDNFLAEQTDAMASMKLFGEINTKKLIKYMLKNDLKSLPDKPVWVDGSGLSRYNLFSPADMITLLTVLYHSFSPERIFKLLPTGGKGTLKYYYQDIPGKVFAKTGSLKNNVTLSGYLITQKKHILMFSILINHCRSPLSVGRHAMEDFLKAVRLRF